MPSPVIYFSDLLSDEIRRWKSNHCSNELYVTKFDSHIYAKQIFSKWVEISLFKCRALKASATQLFNTPENTFSIVTTGGLPSWWPHGADSFHRAGEWRLRPELLGGHPHQFFKVSEASHNREQRSEVQRSSMSFTLESFHEFFLFLVHSCECYSHKFLTLTWSKLPNAFPRAWFLRLCDQNMWSKKLRSLRIVIVGSWCLALRHFRFNQNTYFNTFSLPTKLKEKLMMS